MNFLLRLLARTATVAGMKMGPRGSEGDDEGSVEEYVHGLPPFPLALPPLRFGGVCFLPHVCAPCVGSKHFPHW